MTALAPLSTAPPARRRSPVVWAGVLAAGACVLAAGCSAGSPSATGAGRAMGHMKAAVHGALTPLAAAPAPAAGPSAPGRPAGRRLRLTALAPPSQSIIYTATLTVRAANVATAVARATRLAESAGGYVSAEHSSQTTGRTARALVSIQFKIPVSTYPGTLAALTGLGTKLSETQRTQDVTQTVADVNSRVASAEAAIIQLRRLLARAGTVNGLLTVQDQINQEEASLEELMAQQRALAGETTYATVSMVVQGPAPVHHRHHRAKPVAGFLGGLTAGWHALRRAVAALLTVAGAVLPFAVVLALLAAAGYAARRRLTRRKAGASPAQ